MKLAYIIPATYNSAGMERVLSNKANYLADLGYNITIITTDQRNRAPYFAFRDTIRQVDLGVNFSDIFSYSPLRRAIAYRSKQREYRVKLKSYLLGCGFDIVVSTFGPEFGFLPGINDGSRKVAELHFSRNFRLHMSSSFWQRLRARYRIWLDSKVVRRYDRVVFLTKQDCESWGGGKNMLYIPNACQFVAKRSTTLSEKRAIAVGRFTYQKGYDYMISVWCEVVKRHSDWVLDIYGSGELEGEMREQIGRLNLWDNVRINAPVPGIEGEFSRSSIYLLSSRSEGLPMVLLEAMSQGVPCVSFACECGPEEVIDSGCDGFLVDFGDVSGMVDKVCLLIEDSVLRNSMGDMAVEKIGSRFSLGVVMDQWVSLFRSF